MRRFLAFVILLPLAWTLVLCIFYWQGNTDPAWRARVLRYFTAEDIARGFEYHRAFAPSSAVWAAATWGLLAWLVFGGRSRRLADRALALARGRWFLGVVLTALAVALALRIAVLPVSVFEGYVLQGRFGFRRLDFLPWAARLLTGWAVRGGLQVLVAALFLFAVRRFPRRFVPITAVAGAVISFVLTIVWQPLVLPLFYRVSPLPAGPLRDGVAAMAARAGVPVSEIRLIDHSRVSAHTGAFFSGIGDRRQIYLYDTLSEQHDVPEVLAVVAHEIGHWRQQHVLKGWGLWVLGLALGLALLRRLLEDPAFLAAAGARSTADPALIPAVWALGYAALVAVPPIENAISRRFEREADRAAIELIADPDTFVKMKVEGARANRDQLLPHRVLVFWRGSHPTTIERIEMAAGKDR